VDRTCPHCMDEADFEPLTDDELARVPRAWKLGQVGPHDKVFRCRQCKKLVAIDQLVQTIVRVGMSEFA